jgi:hypothetical protein
MAFHLLTEEELDNIASYYHQATPSEYTHQYPATMNWDKDFLAKRPPPTPRAPAAPSTINTNTTSNSNNNPSIKDGKIQVHRRRSRQLSHAEDVWLEDLMHTVEDLRSPLPPSQDEMDVDGRPGNSANPYANLSERERIRIKRRKVGKFIGLVGMETPAEEIAGRIQMSLDLAVARSRAELQRNEEIMLRRRKMA